MREFKFRAWSEETKMMYYSHRKNGTDNPLWSYDAVFRGNNPKTHIMQHTGLRDKNNVEIYEGDILRREHFVRWGRNEGEVYETLTTVVEWGTQGFILKRIGKSSAYILDMTKYEVVGNIHQHPELVEDTA